MSMIPNGGGVMQGGLLTGGVGWGVLDITIKV